MNWKSLRLVACAFVASLAVASCSKEDARDVAAGEGSRNQNVKINLNLDIEDLAPELEGKPRLLIKDRPKKADGSNNGVQFVFDTLANNGQGEKVKLHTYFRQGNTIKVGTPIDIYVKGMKTLGNTSTPVWSALGELSVPAGINLNSSDDIFVAGAIGVKSIDASGKAVIEPANVDIDAEDSNIESIVPMYFPEIKLNKSTKTLSKSAHLRFYGALVEIELKNNMYEPLLLSQVVMRTDAFTSKGSMKLTTATETRDPDWEPVQYPTKWVKVDAQGNPVTTGQRQRVEVLGEDGRTSYEWVDVYAMEDSKDQTISFSSDRLDRGGTKKAFLWVKPADYTGRKNMKLWVREGNYAYAPEARNEAIAKTYDVKKLETKVYRLPVINAIPSPELIYTEHRRQALRFMWEIYNPTNEDVDLSQYWQNRLKWPNRTRLNIVKSTKLTDGSVLALAYDKRGRGLIRKSGSHRTYLTNNPVPSKMILKPGEMIVYLTWDLATNEMIEKIKNRGNVAYIVYFDGWNSGMPNAFVGDADYHDMYVLTKGGAASMRDQQTVKRDNVADSFMYFESAKSRRRTNEVSYARRPDRTFGRKFWAPGEDGPNCDWVYRTLNERDFGYRFGWYYVPGAQNGGLPLDSRDNGNFFVYLKNGGISYTSFKIPKIWTQDIASTR